MLLAAGAHIVPHGLTVWDGVHAAVILVVAIVLSQVARRLVVRAFGGRAAPAGASGTAGGERVVARITARVLAYVVVLAGLVYALMALHVAIGPLVGALGIGGIALAFALQDILQNLVAGVILQARRPIRHGDQVEVGSYAGVVRDIDLRTVLVRTFDGLDVYVPNRSVLENPIVNYTISPVRRLTVPVGVGYDSDLGAVQRCLVDAVRGVDGVLADPPPAAWVTGFGPSSIDVSVLVWFAVATHGVWQVQSDTAVAIKAALDAAGVTIPFPQQTVSVDPATLRAVTASGSGDRDASEADAGDAAEGHGHVTDDVAGVPS
jgi:small conductance mechanosensitive channel